MKRILILTASPIRDKYIDELLAETLRKMDNEVFVRPCLREGRDAVLELKPNVVVVPPVRNPYSRDFCDVIKHFGMGVVSRHTEPSCDWPDWKRANPQQRAQIMGVVPYTVDAELVWSEDEAQILSRRKTPFPVHHVGAIGLDIYHWKELVDRLTNRGAFNEKHGFIKTDKTLLITSPWGFADSAPDLRIDDNGDAKRDIEGRDRHLAMIRTVHDNLPGWNILLTVHSGVVTDPYTKLAKELGLPIDSTSPMIEMLPNVDAVIHAGSTTALSAHVLGIPAFQFGDVNAKLSNSWWGMAESAISRVSPFFTDPEQMASAISVSERKSNANPKTIDELEKGRYGSMDGQAHKRAAEIINTVNGEFRLCWPKAHYDYDQLGYVKKADSVVLPMYCGVCRNTFYALNKEWADRLKKQVGMTPEQMARLGFQNTLCPHCASRFFGDEQAE